MDQVLAQQRYPNDPRATVTGLRYLSSPPGTTLPRRLPARWKRVQIAPFGPRGWTRCPIRSSAPPASCRRQAPGSNGSPDCPAERPRRLRLQRPDRPGFRLCAGDPQPLALPDGQDRPGRGSLSAVPNTQFAVGSGEGHSTCHASKEKPAKAGTAVPFHRHMIRLRHIERHRKVHQGRQHLTVRTPGQTCDARIGVETAAHVPRSIAARWAGRARCPGKRSRGRPWPASSGNKEARPASPRSGSRICARPAPRRGSGPQAG